MFKAIRTSVYLGNLAIISIATAGIEPYLEYTWAESSAFKSGGPSAAYEAHEWGVGLRGFQRPGGNQFAYDLSYGNLDANWNNGNPLSSVSGPLFDSVRRLESSIMWTVLPRDKWGFWILGGVDSSWAGESPWETASFSDALSFSAGVAANYQLSPLPVLGIGLIYRTGPAGIDEDWIPILQVYWKINDQWTLETRNGVILTWRAESAGRQSLAFAALWNSRQFHLGDEGSNEYGYEEDGLDLGLTYSFELGGNFFIEPSVSYQVAREATISWNGKKLLESDLSDGWKAGVT